MVHIVDAIQKGHSNCLIRTVDTDIIVILVGKFFYLLSLNPNINIWVAFGKGKTFSNWHINSVCTLLGKEKSSALPVFHSFTGCDTTSGFYGKGKKIAWEAWKSFPDVTRAFTNIAIHPFVPLTDNSHTFSLLERFAVVVYNKTCHLESVDETRMELFCHRNRTIENLSPTRAALFQHSLRSIYQASIWTSSEIPRQEKPSPESWGWSWDESTKAWTPVWTTLPVASQACLELVKCSCKSIKGCGTRCSCKKANWTCTELCKCNCIN